MGVSTRKAALSFLLMLILVVATACGSANAESGETVTKEKDKYASGMPDAQAVSESLLKADKMKIDANATKNHIENIIQNQVATYNNVVVDSITVMSMQGTDNADDYTVRCYMAVNSIASASEAYKLSSDFTKELASRLDAYSGAAGELSVVWTVEQISGSGRITYKQKDGALELSSEDFDDNFKVDEGAES